MLISISTWISPIIIMKTMKSNTGSHLLMQKHLALRDYQQDRQGQIL
jgi:hypothetical protein